VTFGVVEGLEWQTLEAVEEQNGDGAETVERNDCPQAPDEGPGLGQAEKEEQEAHLDEELQGDIVKLFG
jgi:hypothetical protein